LLLALFVLASVASAAQHEGHGEPLEESGTSWIPMSSPMEAMHFTAGSWAFMLHGFVNFVHQQESEPRGDSGFFSTNMIGLGGERPIGSGRFGFRVMASLEPTLGSRGYPLLLQTGETADSRNPLFDRQHPHDLFMEIAAKYERRLGSRGAWFVYFAPVGQPALGPAAFMHRLSASDNPVAPLSHHWLDGTHISYGVLTFGWRHAGKLKLDGSLFNGREPDPERWDVEAFALDSFSARVTYQPSSNWSIQASAARLSEPDRLHPSLDVIAFTATATHNRPLGRGNWQTTLAYGRNDTERLTSPPETLPPGVHIHFTPGISPVQHAALAETGLRFRDRHTIFGRFEWAQKNELFLAADRRHDLVFDVSKATVGYVFDVLALSFARIGAGAYGSAHFLPDDLDFVYGQKPRSFGIFLRFKIV
jgi:hypothetical protein